MFLLLLSAVLAFYFTWYVWYLFNRRNWPTGGFPLPFYGTHYQIDYKHLPKSLTKLNQKFGSVMRGDRVCNHPFLIISDYDTIKKLFAQQSHVASGRLQRRLIFRDYEGILFTDYTDAWKKQRRFAAATLKLFGVGNRNIEAQIATELSYLLDEIKSQNGELFDIKLLLHRSTASIIHSVLAGERLQSDSAVYKTCIQDWNNLYHDKSMARKMAFLRTFYFMRFFPYFKDTYIAVLNNYKESTEAIMAVIERHRDNFNDNDIRDFVDQYLLEMKKENVDKSFTYGMLSDIWLDLFLAGNDTSANMLQWCLIAVAGDQTHQVKVYKEIEDVIGSSDPSLQHRDRMPYMQAFLQEMYRMVPVVPFTGRTLTEDATIKGFNIPKRTMILANFWGLHHDPHEFPSPDKFDPNRFIDENGGFIRCEKVIPFSLGPRNCLGQQLATTEVFMIFCGILQKFHVEADGQLPKFDEGIVNITYSPKAFKLKYQLR